MRSQSRHSVRTVRTQRSAYAFALGAFTGVRVPLLAALRKTSSKASVNLAVPITHEEPAATVELWALEDEISGLLRNPGGVRLPGAATDVHPPAPKLDEEEHVQS